jgi:hypothetical protein
VDPIFFFFMLNFKSSLWYYSHPGLFHDRACHASYDPFPSFASLLLDPCCVVYIPLSSCYPQTVYLTSHVSLLPP